MTAPSIPPTYGPLTRARILRPGDLDDTYVVQAPSIAPELAFGPIPSAIGGLNPGDTVLLAQVGTTRGDQVIIAQMPPGELIIGIPDIDGLQDALDARVLDTDFDMFTAATAAHFASTDASVGTNAANITVEHTTNVNQDAAITALQQFAFVRTEAELLAALTAGKTEIRVDSSVQIVLTNQVEINYSTRIVGGRFLRNSGCAFHVTASNVAFTNVHINGGGGSTYDNTQKLIYAQGTQGTPLTHIAVRGCRLFGSRGDNVWLEWCTDSLVANSLIDTFLYSGVMLISCSRTLVSGNVIRNSPLTTGVVNCYGIAVTDMLNTLAARSQDCTIVGNQVSLIDWEGIDTHGGRGLTITGNTVTACPRSIALVVGNETRLTAPQECVVSGNRCNAFGARRAVREGIFVGGIANTPADATVTGNDVRNHSPNFYTNYVDRSLLYIGGNNPPFRDWTAITLDGDFNANGTYTPEYRVDGNTVTLRGGVIPKSSTVRTVIGHITDPAAWPSILTFVGYMKGSNASAGNAMCAVDTDGSIKMFYMSGTDTYTYFLNGNYQAV